MKGVEVAHGSPDRRRTVRFEVVGDLWGTLATSASARVCDVNEGGLLVESPRALPVGSAHQIRLVARRGTMVIPVRVCHVEPAPGPAGEQYRVGLEFISVPPGAVEWLAGLADADSWPAVGTDEFAGAGE